MATERKLGTAFVEILAKGMATVQADLKRFGAAIGTTQKAATALKKAATFTGAIRADTSAIDKSIADTKAKLDGLQAKRLTVTGDTSQVDKAIAQVGDELASLQEK